jgi:hypothetical protein
VVKAAEAAVAVVDVGVADEAGAIEVEAAGAVAAEAEGAAVSATESAPVGASVAETGALGDRGRRGSWRDLGGGRRSTRPRGGDRRHWCRGGRR